MSDLIVSYKGSPIIDLSASGSKTIKTAGKYCEADLSLQYTKPSGGGAFILITSTKGATLTCGDQTYTLTGDETEHAFAVSLGTYVCTASKTGLTTRSETVVVSEETVYKVKISPSRLPVEYQEVEYIGLEGSQYIDTEYRAPYGYFTDFTVRYNGGSSLVGSGYDAGMNNARNYVSVQPSVSFQIGAYGCNTSKFADAIPGGKYKIAASTKSRIINIDGVEYDASRYAWSLGFQFPTNNFTILIGGQHDGRENNLKADFVGNFYGDILIGDSPDTIVRKFVPCYRTSDNKPGMYDLAGSVCSLTNSPFYINAGSGEFIVGPDV